jgi:mannose-6-phosphate isomerase-like protein (cupin superfamily)
MAAGSELVAPDGSTIRPLVSDAQRASLVEVTLPAGRTSKPVWHRQVEEIWYFLEGEGRVWLQEPGTAGRSAEVRPGDRVVIPTGWRFQFSAGPGGPLRFLCYTSPPWPGDEEAQPAPEGGLGPPTVR